ncbi:MAG: hypothetical protein RJA44_1015, partial [Pseudomonadota bacterium]
SFYTDKLGRELSMQQFQCLPQGRIEAPAGGTKLGLKPISEWPEAQREDAWQVVARDIEAALRHREGAPDAAPAAAPASRQFASTFGPGEPGSGSLRPAAPPRWRRLLLPAGLGLALLAGGTSFWAESVKRDVRASLRIDRAADADERLASLPAVLGLWPGLADLRSITRLHLDGLNPKADTVQLDTRLEALARRLPDDPDLLYLKARTAYRSGDLETLRSAAGAALQHDPQHAAAQALLGLAADVQGDLGNAERHYARAATLAPKVPQYASNHARALLDQGRPAEALQIYQGLSNFALAPVEQALAYWSQGQLAKAEASQAAALDMLADPVITAQQANQRAWQFMFLDPAQPDQMLAATLSPEHRRCYVSYERAISRLLLDGQPAGQFSEPADCQGIEQIGTIRDIVDADLCRYLILRQPDWATAAQALRQSRLDRRKACPPLLATTPAT